MERWWVDFHMLFTCPSWNYRIRRISASRPLHSKKLLRNISYAGEDNDQPL